MKFIACGEALFSSRNLANRLDKKLVEQFWEADTVFVNAEFCTPEYDTPPAAGRGYTTSVKPDTLDEFADLNMNMVAFANNHTGDYGSQGVEDTIHAAEQRNLTYCGIGRNLDGARQPKFYDAPTGRLGVVAFGTTRSEVFAAGSAGAGMCARPGLNPLRWKQRYVLPKEAYEQLQQIDRLLGTQASMEECLKIETMHQPEGSFRFGSLFEGNLLIEQGEPAGVRTYANEADEQALLKSIQDCSKRSDFALVSMHTHEGINENWYSSQPAGFIEEFAHKAIDAGASAIVGHGAHFLRGVEIYNNRPIFYNLGCILMEFEAGESKIPPEMYEAYGYGPGAVPSDLHSGRAKDASGNFIGFNADRRFSKHCYCVFDATEHGVEYKLVPIDLHLDHEKPLKRGLPALASAQVGREIAEDLERASVRYGTGFRYNETDGTISIYKK